MRYVIDRRAGRLAEVFKTMPDDLLLDTRQVAELLEVSASFLEERRIHGGGPTYRRLGRSIRYKVEDVRTWLDERAHQRTAEYSSGGKAGRQLMAHTRQQIARRRLGGAS